MGKFIITEEEKNRIRGLYEQSPKTGVSQNYAVKEIKSGIQVGYVSPQTGFTPIPKYASQYPKDPKGINSTKFGKILTVVWSKASARSKPSGYTGYYQ